MGEERAPISQVPDWAPLELYEGYSASQTVTFPDAIDISEDTFSAQVKLEGSDEVTATWTCTIESAHVLTVLVSADGLTVGKQYVADLRWEPSAGEPVPLFRWYPITMSASVTS